MTPKHPDHQAIYNSRIIDTFIKLIKRRYPQVRIGELLAYADMQGYEVADQAHWFTQEQINRFYSRAVELTGSTQIAREAGRYAASPEAMGTMRQYILGLVGPANAFNLIHKASAKFTHSAFYESRRLADNRVEVKVRPHPGIQEQAFQCENRIGFFEAVCLMFNNYLPQVEHTECLFHGGECCRYTITWKRTPSAWWKKARNITTATLVTGCALAAFWNPLLAATTLAPLAATIILLVALQAQRHEQQELRRSLKNLADASEDLSVQLNINYSNALMTNEIGKAISAPTAVDEILDNVVQILQNRLDFDRGLILLADEQRSRLIFRNGFGYTREQFQTLNNIAFHLDRPGSRGIFVVAFQEQTPFLVDNIDELQNDLSRRSLELIEKLGTRSFICCPIICEGSSIGILAVDNPKSQRPLLQSDVSLLMGIAPVLGISIRNADLLLTKERQFHSTLKVLAATIDARDPLTAGHSEKVTQYAMDICQELDLDALETERIRVAALLHDYGKIGVPDAILKKEGRLTEEEYAIVKTHTDKTRSILQGINFEGIYRDVPDIAGAHHEHIDGSGYPLGLHGSEIPLGAKIIAVADFFEAITAKRHYRDPMPTPIAYQLLQRQSGRRFAPEIVDAFITRHKTQNASPPTGADGRPQRIPCRTPVSLRINSHAALGTSEDISTNGIFVSIPEPVQEGTMVRLVFSLPGVYSPPMEAIAKVVWTNNACNKTKPDFPAGNGLQFTQVPEEVVFTLNNFVHQSVGATMH